MQCTTFIYPIRTSLYPSAFLLNYFPKLLSWEIVTILITIFGLDQEYHKWFYFKSSRLWRKILLYCPQCADNFHVDLVISCSSMANKPCPIQALLIHHSGKNKFAFVTCIYPSEKLNKNSKIYKKKFKEN